MIDLSMMKSIRVDPDAKRVRVEAGCEKQATLLFVGVSHYIAVRYLG